MLFCRLVLTVFLAALVPFGVSAQSVDNASAELSLELNTVRDVADACRLSFVAQNRTGAAIEELVFETVVFDTSGGVVSLSLFDFRTLPVDRPRVRQFDLPGMACDTVGQVLINGANTCVVAGADSDLCDMALTLNSRVAAELIG